MTKNTKRYQDRRWLFKIFFKPDWNREKGQLRAVWDYLLLTILILLVLAGTIGVVGSTYQFFEHRQCDALSSLETSRDYQWSYWTGCVVRTTEGFWIDASSPALREVDGRLDLYSKE